MKTVENNGIMQVSFKDWNIIELWFGSWKAMDNESCCVQIWVDSLFLRVGREQKLDSVYLQKGTLP